MHFSLNLSHYVKNCGHFCQILAFFIMPAHQILSYHVTKKQISHFFYFVLILHLILGKITKLLVEKLYISEVSSQKPQGSWKYPVPLGLMELIFISSLYGWFSVRLIIPLCK